MSLSVENLDYGLQFAEMTDTVITNDEAKSAVAVTTVPIRISSVEKTVEKQVSKNRKPLGIKSYGHIPHLSGSRLGPGDHKCQIGQERIACEKVRDKYDRIIVQEKLDGSNVAVARLNGEILSLNRPGYLADTSPHKMHHDFAKWVHKNETRFRAVLREGQRVCGEWLQIAHGTRYRLLHEPFVAFDIITKHDRMPYDEFVGSVSKGKFTIPRVVHIGKSISIDDAMGRLGDYGLHGALDKIEGAIWRVERDPPPGKKKKDAGARKTKVAFLVKYVRPDKIDGKYLGKEIYNTFQSD